MDSASAYRDRGPWFTRAHPRARVEVPTGQDRSHQGNRFVNLATISPDLVILEDDLVPKLHTCNRLKTLPRRRTQTTSLAVFMLRRRFLEWPSGVGSIKMAASLQRSRYLYGTTQSCLGYRTPAVVTTTIAMADFLLAATSACQSFAGYAHSNSQWGYWPLTFKGNDVPLFPDRVTGFSQVGIVPDDAVGRRVFSGISRFRSPFIPTPLYTHLNHPHRLPRPRCSEPPKPIHSRACFTSLKKIGHSGADVTLMAQDCREERQAYRLPMSEVAFCNNSTRSLCDDTPRSGEDDAGVLRRHPSLLPSSTEMDVGREFSQVTKYWFPISGFRTLTPPPGLIAGGKWAVKHSHCACAVASQFPLSSPSLPGHLWQISALEYRSRKIFSPESFPRGRDCRQSPRPPTAPRTRMAVVCLVERNHVYFNLVVSRQVIAPELIALQTLHRSLVLAPKFSVDIHGDLSPFLLQPFHELSNGFWQRLTSPHPAIQFVPKMFYRVLEVGVLGGQTNGHGAAPECNVEGNGRLPRKPITTIATCKYPGLYSQEPNPDRSGGGRTLWHCLNSGSRDAVSRRQRDSMQVERLVGTGDEAIEKWTFEKDNKEMNSPELELGPLTRRPERKIAVGRLPAILVNYKATEQLPNTYLRHDSRRRKEMRGLAGIGMPWWDGRVLEGDESHALHLLDMERSKPKHTRPESHCAHVKYVPSTLINIAVCKFRTIWPSAQASCRLSKLKGWHRTLAERESVRKRERDAHREGGGSRGCIPAESHMYFSITRGIQVLANQCNRTSIGYDQAALGSTAEHLPYEPTETKRLPRETTLLHAEIQVTVGGHYAGLYFIKLHGYHFIVQQEGFQVSGGEDVAAPACDIPEETRRRRCGTTHRGWLAGRVVVVGAHTEAGWFPRSRAAVSAPGSRLLHAAYITAPLLHSIRGPDLVTHSPGNVTIAAGISCQGRAAPSICEPPGNPCCWQPQQHGETLDFGIVAFSFLTLFSFMCDVVKKPRLDYKAEDTSTGKQCRSQVTSRIVRSCALLQGSLTSYWLEIDTQTSFAHRHAALQSENGATPECNDGEREIPEKTRRPAASSGTIPTCSNPGMIRAGIEPGSPWWEASRLTAHPPGVGSITGAITRSFAGGNRDGRCCWPAGFLRMLQLPPPLHSAPPLWPPHFAFIASEDLAGKHRPKPLKKYT
ncbi:hypothetical protein PR048_021353 [Dryococelus australis]|uniref:Uncharacterized protein n=1 Tax=Dryococelus australis TaxID=614101 RepID=A0ABQ9GXY6_9NEOP|nr:hypothetical protein PR048_021353 [Dryococelus australis]